MNKMERDFEFLLTLGNNIVCQRLFSVPNFNEKTLKSLELYDEIKFICLDMVKELKNKNAEYLLENSEYFLNNDYVEVNDLGERFSLKLSYKNNPIMERIFDSEYFHPKVRYAVDIRGKLKTYLKNLTETLSLRKVQTTYINKPL